MPADDEPAPVVVEGLVKRFGSCLAVDDMSLRARRARITTILGPNGAGKTTAIACLLGLLRPDAGSVRVLAEDPWRAEAGHRARVGVMLQDGGLPNTVGARRLLEHLARLYAGAQTPQRVASEWIDRLAIGPFERTPVRRLSGGQRQKVALAAALLGRPEVAFLDEPTAGLDPHARLETWRLLREQRDAGRTLIVTTHSFEEAERLADDVVIVASGKAVAQGTLAQVVPPGASLEATYFALTGNSEDS
ncbi:putative ABC transporter ATP-binding protein [Kineosphaera limosa NBRC 100340]|uniref:Putative ABC transporter ATP-binding protein n=1 Tax=Kineosphaera limosa NBRC 100340 TaxID=1184609 RepID=K6W5M7_9MICO|nr:putative ABC transporter ATP-binding protein [Kineosphaera limosa NBRC 100340]